MATQTRLVDDIDGTSDSVRTHRFSLDTTTWEIDLNGDNLAALRTALAPFIHAGRRATQIPTPTGHAGGAAAAKQLRADIRAWWADNHATAGLPAPGAAQGRIPADVVNAYNARP